MRWLDRFIESVSRKVGDALTLIPWPVFPFVIITSLGWAACHDLERAPPKDGDSSELEVYRLEADGRRYLCIGYRHRNAGLWCERQQSEGSW